MNFMVSLKRMGLAASLSIGLAAAAYAGPLTVTPNGSFSGSYNAGDGPGVTTTYAGGNAWEIGTTTTAIQLNGGIDTLTGRADPYLGNPNNLRSANGGLISLNYTVPFTLSSDTFAVTNGTISPLTLTISPTSPSAGTYVFTFTSEKVVTDANGSIDLAFLGNFVSQTGGGNQFTLPASADFSVTFTQSAYNGSVGVAFSIDTPPNPALVPEPATLAMLGAGMLGLSITRRRRR